MQGHRRYHGPQENIGIDKGTTAHRRRTNPRDAQKVPGLPGHQAGLL
jgi:hypothetical protein